MTKALTDSDFEQTVSNADKPIVVDFWAEWCGPCRQLSPTLEAVAGELGDTIDVYKMNIDENPEAPTNLGVRSIPTLVMYKDGQVVATKTGNMPKNILSEWINENL